MHTDMKYIVVKICFPQIIDSKKLNKESETKAISRGTNLEDYTIRYQSQKNYIN